MKIQLIRHGLTALSEQKRYQGALDTGLSPAGRQALRRADTVPGHVYVSPMLRARETASILFPGAELIPVPDLREMDFGLFEGRGWWEMEQDPAYRRWVDGGCVSRCPEGEAREDFTARVCAAMRELLRRDEELLVIVAHGGTQMAVLEKCGSPARAYYEWQTPCGCGWLLEYDREGERLAVVQKLDYRK